MENKIVWTVFILLVIPFPVCIYYYGISDALGFLFLLYDQGFKIILLVFLCFLGVISLAYGMYRAATALAADIENYFSRKPFQFCFWKSVLGSTLAILVSFVCAMAVREITIDSWPPLAGVVGDISGVFSDNIPWMTAIAYVMSIIVSGLLFLRSNLNKGNMQN